MRLHQLRFEYNAGQDRLLLRVSTHEGTEVLLWLTRRCVRLLWPILVDMAQSSPRIALQSDPLARAAMLEFEHEQALRGADFSRPYEQGERERPFGPEPVLVTRIHHGKDADGNHVLSFSPVSDERVNFALDDMLLHSFCRLLQKAVADTDWDLPLSLPRVPSTDTERSARTIN